ARSLALALDAARLAGDAAMRRRLEAALAAAPWDDDLAAVLAVELLPEAGDGAAAPLRISGGVAEESVDARAGLRWAGRLVSPLRLSGVPGSMLAVDLRWQVAESAQAGAASRIRIAQAGDDGYRVLPDSEALWPGAATALILDLRGLEGAWILRAALPALLQPASPPDAGIFLVEGRAASWPMPETLRDSFRSACSRGEAARDEAIALLDRALTEARPVMRPSGVRIEHVLDSGRSGDLIDQELPGGALVAVPLGTLGDGEAVWPGLELHGPDGALLRLQPPPVRIAAGQPAEVETAGMGHPLRADILAAAGRAEVAALAGLAYCDSEADWRQALRSIDPQAGHDLTDLLLHPLCGRSGHWTVRELRRWVEGEPALQSLPTEGAWSLQRLCLLARDSRRERDEVRLAIHGVQEAARPSATVQAWYAAAVAAGRLPRQEWELWLWRQSLEPADLADLGYDRTIDGWIAFCRLELGLPMRLGPGMRGDAPWQGGEALGTVATAAVSPFVIERDAGVLMLRPPRLHVRAMPAPVAVDFADVDFPAALAAMNLLLANRGLPALTLAEGVDATALPAVTLRADAAWTMVADALARCAGLERAGLLIRPAP
ncbi:MAG: hypothetical protein J0M02_15695, partial [Planctomycetes bacterium]|nr:hypothetical protein [Planctomycetota bacterium]